MTTGTARRDALRKLAYNIRAIPGERFGLRPFTVQIVSRSWSGDVVGEGTETVTTTTLTEANGQPPKVRQLNSEEIALGGLARGSLKIGPITPDFPGGGTTIAALSGSSVTAGDLFHFLVSGPGLPSGGARFALVDIETDHALHYMVTVSPHSEA